MRRSAATRTDLYCASQFGHWKAAASGMLRTCSINVRLSTGVKAGQERLPLMAASCFDDTMGLA
jgi:hypothetical protein